MSVESFYALPVLRQVQVGGVYIFRSMSPAHTSELLFRTGTCVRVTARPDSRGRVQVTFKDQAKFNLGINNLVQRSEQADEAASEMRTHVQELQSEFSERSQPSSRSSSTSPRRAPTRGQPPRRPSSPTCRTSCQASEKPSQRWLGLFGVAKSALLARVLAQVRRQRLETPPKVVPSRDWSDIDLGPQCEPERIALCHQLRRIGEIHDQQHRPTAAGREKVSRLGLDLTEQLFHQLPDPPGPDELVAGLSVQLNLKQATHTLTSHLNRRSVAVQPPSSPH